MRLIPSQNRQESTAEAMARASIAADLHMMRAMGGPPVLRQAVAGLIHLALHTEPKFWLQHAQGLDFAGQFAALRLCRYALAEISKSVNESAATALDYHRTSVRLIEHVAATPEEATAKIYWEAMEKMDAAGIDFEQLLTYHYQSDAETEL